MNKEEKIKKIKSISGTSVYRGFTFKYDKVSTYYYVLDNSDKLFLGLKEDDFQTNGFCIRKIKHIKKIKNVSETVLNISRSLGLPETEKKPDIDLKTWKTALESLCERGCFLIVENERKNGFFYIGKVCGLYKNKFEFSPIDADGVWGADIMIKYSDLTSIAFGDRYSKTWEEYLENGADSFGSTYTENSEEEIEETFSENEEITEDIEDKIEDKIKEI